MILVSKAVKLFQLIGIIWLRFSLFQKWSNYSNLLEWSDRDSVYFRSDQIILTYWNYLTKIQFISEVVKLFQLIGIIWPSLNFQNDVTLILHIFFYSYCVKSIANKKFKKLTSRFTIAFKNSMKYVFYAQQQSHRSVQYFFLISLP